MIKAKPPKARATVEAGGQKGHFYRPLPTRFRHNGFDYRQTARKGAVAIYEQVRAGCSNPSVRYEVIRIRRRDGFHIDGRFVEPAEVYPNSEAWGVDGFTLTAKDAAFARLREISSGGQSFELVIVNPGGVIAGKKRAANTMFAAQTELDLKDGRERPAG